MNMTFAKAAVLDMSLVLGLVGTAGWVAAGTADGKARSRYLCQRSMPWVIKCPAREDPSWK
jgi:hypothetical protein